MLLLQVIMDTCQDAAQLASLRNLALGAEALNPATLAKAQQMAPEAVIYNCYGPTEASVMVTTFPCAEYSGVGSVPIGRPIYNVRLYVLDPQSLLPLPVGVPGELFASGVGVARGYAGQPELTAERFLPNPFSQPGDSVSYSRMYRTGDVVAWMPDGNLRSGIFCSGLCCFLSYATRQLLKISQTSSLLFCHGQVIVG